MPLRNLTITVEQNVARWARSKAADENELEPIPGTDAAPRISREGNCMNAGDVFFTDTNLMLY